MQFLKLPLLLFSLFFTAQVWAFCEGIQDYTIEGNYELAQGATHEGSIYAMGSATIRTDSIFKGMLCAIGEINIGKYVELSGDINTKSSVTVGEGAQLSNGNVEALGRISLLKNTLVNGNVTSESTVGTDENAVISGYISAQGNVAFGKGGVVKADIISNGLVTLGDNSIVEGDVCAKLGINYGNNYTVLGTITEGEFCEVTLPDDDHYFEIITSTDALTCESHSLQVRVIDSNDGSVVTDFNNEITLTTNPTLGTWGLSDGQGDFDENGIGNASYQFDERDGGSATFSLFNPIAGELTVTVTDGTKSTTSDVITFRPFELRSELSCEKEAKSGQCLNTANKPFTMKLTAVGKEQNSDGCGVIEEYTGSKKLKFWSTYLNPSDPLGFKIVVNGAKIERLAENAIDQSVTFTNGIASVSVAYPDAGKIQLHARDDVGIGALPEDPEQRDELQGSTITILNPLQLVISNITGNQRNNSKAVTSTPSNPASTQAGDGFIRASIPDYADLRVDTFDVTVKAVKYCEDAVTSEYCEGNYGAKTTAFRGDITLKNALIFPASGSAKQGTLHSENGLTQPMPGVDGGAQRGEFTYSDLSFDEVGTLGLAVESLNYFGIEGNDITTEKDNNGDYVLTEVGRFYPDYLALTENSFTSAPFISANDFAYIGDPNAVAISYQLIAYAQTSENAKKITANYDEGLGYPVATASGVAHFAFTQNDNELKGYQDSSESNRIIANEFYDQTRWKKGVYETDGEGLSQFKVGLKRTVDASNKIIPDGPFNKGNEVSYRLQIIGNDGERLQYSATESCFDNRCELGDLSDLRYGRLQAGNGHGGEFQSMRTLLETTYYIDDGFVPLKEDNGTYITNAQFSATPSMDKNNSIDVGNGTTSLTILDSTLINGKGYLQFLAPNDRGALDYFIRLEDSNDSSLYSPWLLDSGNAVTCPAEAGGLKECISGNVQFGLFRGNDRVIYRRQTSG